MRVAFFLNRQTFKQFKSKELDFFVLQLKLDLNVHVVIGLKNLMSAPRYEIDKILRSSKLTLLKSSSLVYFLLIDFAAFSYFQLQISRAINLNLFEIWKKSRFELERSLVHLSGLKSFLPFPIKSIYKD